MIEFLSRYSSEQLVIMAVCIVVAVVLLIIDRRLYSRPNRPNRTTNQPTDTDTDIDIDPAAFWRKE